MAKGGRWIHRRGMVFQGMLQSLDGTGPLRPALARLSLTFGWPRPLPDFVGLAIRLEDDGNGNTDQGDLLLASARPSRDLLGCSFTSVVPYLVQDEMRVVRAIPSEPRSAELASLANGNDPCPIGYHIDGVGELLLTERLTDDPALRFRPPSRGPRLITALRSRIYAWSQRRQPAQPAESRLEQVAAAPDAH